METVNNITNTASRAIWGEGQNSNASTTDEPVSGVKGNTAQGEPYDGGNLDRGATDEAKFNEDGTSMASGKQAGANKPSSRTPNDSTKAQADTRGPGEGGTRPGESEQRSNVDDSQGTLDRDDNPVKVEGKGPKPIEEVARERGGDAGKVSSESVDREGRGGEEEEGGEDGEDGEDGPQKKSHGEGTGELYVKSSGLKADGGDFDASQPGAGREADRLMEQKGIVNPSKDDKPGPPGQEADGHHSQQAATNDGASDKSGKTKVSLKDKLKSKVHH